MTPIFSLKNLINMQGRNRENVLNVEGLPPNLMCSSHISLVGRLVIILKLQATETNSDLVSYYSNGLQ